MYKYTIIIKLSTIKINFSKNLMPYYGCNGGNAEKGEISSLEGLLFEGEQPLLDGYSAGS